MSLVLDDHWIWDFWIARDGADYHLFFLQAPRSLGDPEERHWHVSIGHAVSQDLAHWHQLGTCFRPAEGPAWDDGTTWTGSILRHDGIWHFFYTGTSKADDCRKQRIGLATSTDLNHWQRHPANPIVDLDTRFYEEYDPAVWHDRAFRDPWVMRDPAGSGFRMWFTARVPDGSPDERGVIGTAHSDDLVHWRVEPPVTPPGDFGECEVPQYWEHGGRSYLLFCTSVRRTSAKRRDLLAARSAELETGTHYFIADGPDGPWRLGAGPFLAGTAPYSLYAGRIVEAPDGRPVFLGTIGFQPDGSYVGALSDPIPIEATPDGELILRPESAQKEVRHG
jgi:beta-fructofuranosidase